MVGAFFGAIIKAVMGFFLGRLFPPRTAADQKATDLSASVTEAQNANKIAGQVARESDADLDADLARRVRDAGA